MKSMVPIMKFRALESKVRDCATEDSFKRLTASLRGYVPLEKFNENNIDI